MRSSLNRRSEVVLGNIIGSNIYNILGIGGATGLMAPGAVPGELVAFDNYVMIGWRPCCSSWPASA